MNSKQVIIVRKDLNMRKGKIAAQVAHGSTLALLKYAKKTSTGISLDFKDFGEHQSAVEDWLVNRFTKVVVSVNSLEELERIEEIAKEKGLVHAKITDSGLTEFNGVPTVTVLALGPMESSKFEGVTDHLSLM